MGQTTSANTAESVLEDTVDTIHYEIKKHANILSQIGSLTYEEFHKCLGELNELWVEQLHECLLECDLWANARISSSCLIFQFEGQRNA